MNTLTKVSCANKLTNNIYYNRKPVSEQHDTGKKLYRVFEDGIPQKLDKTLPPIDPNKHRVYEYLNEVDSKKNLLKRIESSDTIQLQINFDVDCYKLCEINTQDEYRKFIQKIASYLLHSVGVKRIQYLFAWGKSDFSSVHIRFRANCNNVDDANHLNALGRHVQKLFGLDTVNPIVDLSRAAGVPRILKDGRRVTPYIKPYLCSVDTEKNNLQCVKKFVDENFIEIKSIDDRSRAKLTGTSITSTGISSDVDIDDLIAGNIHAGYRIDDNRVVTRNFGQFPRGCDDNALLKASETLYRASSIIKDIDIDGSSKSAKNGSKELTENQQLFNAGLLLASSFDRDAVLPLAFLADIPESRAEKIIDDVIEEVRKKGELLEFTLKLNVSKPRQDRIRSHCHEYAQDILTELLHKDSVTIKSDAKSKDGSLNRALKRSVETIKILGLIHIKKGRRGNGWTLTRTTYSEVIDLAQQWARFYLPDHGSVRSSNPIIYGVDEIKSKLDEEVRYQRECRSVQTEIVEMFQEQNIKLGEKTFKKAA